VHFFTAIGVAAVEHGDGLHDDVMSFGGIVGEARECGRGRRCGRRGAVLGW